MRILSFRRFIIGTALALSVSLLGSSSALAAGADVYGVGGGSVNFGTQTKYVKIAFSAHSGSNGDFGSFRWTFEPAATGGDRIDVHVDVDCLNVFGAPPFGAEGWVGGTVTRVTPTDNFIGIAPGDQEVLYIADYDRSGVVKDQFSILLFTSPQECKLLGTGSGLDLDQGNINIKLG